MSDFSKVSELILCLIKMIEGRLTGTFFIVTNTNRSCYIVLREGKIIGAKYDKYKGIDVFVKLKNIEGVKFSFSAMVEMPLDADEEINKNEDVMSLYSDVRNKAKENKAPIIDAVKEKPGFFSRMVKAKEAETPEDKQAKKELNRQKYYRGN